MTLVGLGLMLVKISLKPQARLDVFIAVNLIANHLAATHLIIALTLSLFLSRFIDILITDVPNFIYPHDVYFISILALMTYHTHNFIRILWAS
jgi:hypothetical protein